MHEGSDRGVLISHRPHGESSAILEVFTPSNGKICGVCRSATSKNLRAYMQVGSELDITWRARLEAHMPTLQIEPIRSRAGEAIGDPLRLKALLGITALLSYALPEKLPRTRLYETTSVLLDAIDPNPGWARAYFLWELMLLEDLGFGLDLSRCAVTGRRDGLCYVSPKSGHAVTSEGAGDWADRLLPLPEKLLTGIEYTPTELLDGLRLTEYFLTRELTPDRFGKELPAARNRLVEHLCRATKSRSD